MFRCLVVLVLAWGTTASADEMPSRTEVRGHEPSWRVSLDGDEVALQIEGVVNAVIDVTKRIEGWEYVLEGTEAATGAELTMNMQIGACRDRPTGVLYPITIRATFGDHRLFGCGGDALSWLRNAEFSILEVTEVPAIEDSSAVLRFDVDAGQVSGSTGCNTFTAGFTWIENILSFGPVTLTEMACSEELMNQERMILDALELTDGFYIGQSDAPSLQAAGRTVMITRLR